MAEVTNSVALAERKTFKIPSPVAFVEKVLHQKLKGKQPEILEQMFAPDCSITVLMLGRRSGKTYLSACAAVFAGIMLEPEYRKHLSEGKNFYIILAAPTAEQTKICLDEIRNLLNSNPTIAALVIRDTATEIELSNGCIFKGLPASSRGGRGLAAPLIIFDEFAHFLDSELGNAAGHTMWRALRPATAQFGLLGRVIVPSTPWLKKGMHYELYSKGVSGTDPKIKVFVYPTKVANPDIPQEFLQEEFERDPVGFATEYECVFSETASAFLDHAAIERAINYDRDSLEPQESKIYYIENKTYEQTVSEWEKGGYSREEIEKQNMVQRWFKGLDVGRYYLSLDPAKGHRDAYTACIAHFERKGIDPENRNGTVGKDVLVVDLWHQFSATVIDGKKHFVSIDHVHDWIAEMDKKYNFKLIAIDQYQSQFTIQHFKSKAKVIEEIHWSRPLKQMAYSKMKELLYAERMELYPHAKAIQELRSLMVLRTADGSWTVSGGDGIAVDDFASALAGVVLISDPIMGQQITGQSRAIWACK